MVLIKFKCYKKIYRLKKIKKFVLNLRRYIYISTLLIILNIKKIFNIK